MTKTTFLSKARLLNRTFLLLVVTVALAERNTLCIHVLMYVTGVMYTDYNTVDSKMSVMLSHIKNLCTHVCHLTESCG